MFKIPLPQLKTKILRSGKISGTDLDARIKTKINELSGLISEEGAAHIIANELGVELLQSGDKLKIKEIYAGMRNVTMAGKVVRKYETREFQKEDRLGKVCSLVLGDETGTIRLVLWNDQVELITDLNENDTVLVKDAYVRENNNAQELHLGQSGQLTINPPGEKVAEVRLGSSFQRKKISELVSSEENVEIMGTVVQVFDPRFFHTCPRCRGRANETGGEYTCAEHGPITPATGYVMNLVLDDGTGTIRTVFWKNQLNHLLGKEEQDLLAYKNDLAKFEMVKTDLLGEQYKLRGQVKKNEMFERLEFNVQFVETAKPEEELARLEKQ